MLETELKCIITKDVYDNIKTAFNWDSSAEQVNYYYTDRNGILRKDRVMVRVRVKNGVSKLQVKQRKNSLSPLQICEEKEFDIDGAPERIDERLAGDAVGYDVGELILLGASSTLRSSLMWDENTEICLDKTEYLGAEDYEIEIEYKNNLSVGLKNRLKELGAEFNEFSIGKFSRFMKRFEEVNK